MRQKTWMNFTLHGLLQTFLAIFLFKAHVILKQLFFMDLFKYFNERKNVTVYLIPMVH